MENNYKIPDKEFNKWMDIYKSSKYFAVIKPSRSVCTNSSFFMALSNLYNLGLYPVVIHGAGPDIDKRLEQEGITIKKDKNNTIITDSKTMELLLEESIKTNNFITSSLKDITEGIAPVFLTEPASKDKNNLTAEISGVYKDFIEECLNEKKIPIVSSIGFKYTPSDKSPKDNYFHICADSAFVSLVRVFEPKKAITLNSSGGIYKNEKLLSDIEAEDIGYFAKCSYIKKNDGIDAKALKKILSTHDIQISNPENLIQELFTDNGKGTYIFKKNSVHHPKED